LAGETDDPFTPVVFEIAKRKILEGGGLQQGPLKLLSARRRALSVRSALSTPLALPRGGLPTRALRALALTTGTRRTRGLWSGYVPRIEISGGTRSGFPNDLADRDRLAIPGYTLLDFVLVHIIILVSVLVLAMDEENGEPLPDSP